MDDLEDNFSLSSIILVSMKICWYASQLDLLFHKDCKTLIALFYFFNLD